MRLFRATYRGRDGQKHNAGAWYIEFGLKDGLGRVRRVPAFASRKQSEGLGRRIIDLAALKGAGQTLPAEMSKWIEGLPPRLLRLLARFGLLDAGRVAGLRPLGQHIDGAPDAPGYRQYLTAKGDTARHVEKTCQRIRKVFEGCGFVFFSDVSAVKLMLHLGNMRADTADKRGRGAATVNHHLRACKSFFAWMVTEGLATVNPIACLKLLNARADIRLERRALSAEELRWLLDTTRQGPERFGMSGPERAMVYRLAVESGLRAGELGSLSRASFDLDAKEPTVCLAAARSKRRRLDVLHLRADTAADLRTFLGFKLPGAPAFNIPPSYRTADMIRADLADARAAWLSESATPQERQDRERTSFLAAEDGAGRVCDFHGLRHTCGSLLAAAGVHPALAQRIMRHSTIDLTMSRYTHVFAGQEAHAVEALPDLGASPVKQSAKATGTDGATAQAAPGTPRCPTANDHGPGRPAGRSRAASCDGDAAGDAGAALGARADVLSAKSAAAAAARGDGARNDGAPATGDFVLAECLARLGPKQSNRVERSRLTDNIGGEGASPCEAKELPVESGRNTSYGPVTKLAYVGVLKSPVLRDMRVRIPPGPV